MRSQFNKLVLVCMAFGVGGCNFFDSSTTKLQYMPDMADSPTFKAQETYLEPPEHSVPVSGILYPAGVEEAEKQLKNPYPSSEAVMVEGKALYEKTCIACHASDGKGGHSLGKSMPTPPDITNASYKDRGDGFFFYRITFGLATMPGYGHALSATERWKIVHHLRTLQQ